VRGEGGKTDVEILAEQVTAYGKKVLAAGKKLNALRRPKWGSGNLDNKQYV